MTLQSLQNQRVHDQKLKQQNRKSRRQFDFSISTLRLYSCMRQDDAAKVLGVAPITLKRICNRRNYRWPYRTVKAAERRRERQRAAAIAAAITQQHSAPAITSSTSFPAQYSLPQLSTTAQLPLSPPPAATTPPERRPMSPLALKLASSPATATTTRLPPLRVALHAHFVKQSVSERFQPLGGFSFADAASGAPARFFSAV